MRWNYMVFHTLQLLRVFVTRRNKALTHCELLQGVWGSWGSSWTNSARKPSPTTGLRLPIFMKSLAFLYEFFMRIRLMF